MSTVHLMHDKLEQASNPLAPLALIALPSCEDLAEKINEWISKGAQASDRVKKLMKDAAKAE